ncbi:O-antigen ligase family protein [Aestuariivirga sp.]|uniref:O-antigen ligase family protein n=1 Tax=Aestuariivirga sp. TaxID=2650926 RepID=UPI00391DFF0D
MTADAQSPPDSAAGLGWPLYAFYCAGFVMVGGGFVLYTSGADPRLVREAAAGSPISQLILAMFYSVGALLLISNAGSRRMLKAVWPILLLPALALVSTLWSPDPALSLRRAVAFMGTILFGLSLGSAYRFRDTLGLVAFSMALVMALSIGLAYLDPVRAIHQPDDAIQAVHAGSWRGIFAHRNTLGFWAGASLVILALAGREAFPSRWLQVIAIVAAAACLLATGSRAGIAVVVLGMFYFLIVVSTLNRPARLQGAMIVFWALAGLLAYLSFEEIARVGLWLLGRESDLSGRTHLWSYIVTLVRSADRPLGLGYFVGTLLLDERISAATQWRNVNAHNGFLEAYVYFGWMGLVLSMALALWLLLATARLARLGVAHVGYLAAVPAAVVFFVLAHNLVESTIVSPNNLNNVLLAIAAAMAARASLPEGSARRSFTTRTLREPS